MNWRRLGVALMLVGLLVGATGTYSAISVDADRGFSIGAVGDDPDDMDPNYFDTKDRTDSETAVSRYPATLLRVYNNFGQQVTASELSVTAIAPVNASANDTTTDPDAVSIVDQYSFSEGSSLSAGGDAPVDARCNPDYNQTVRGDHEITVSIVVVGEDSGAEISLDRTVTAPVECN